MLKFRLFLFFSCHHCFLFTLYQIPPFHCGPYPIHPLYFLFASFSNTPDCNLKFDGHHSSYGRLICHYCLKIPQVFVFICVVFAVPFIRCIRLVVYIAPWIRALLQNVMLVRAVKEIPRHLKDLTVYFCVHMILPLGVILR